MPHAANGHTLILTDQLADFYRTIGGDPARRIVGLADGNRLRIHGHAGRLRGEIAAGQAPRGHAQCGVILADDQQQLISRITGIFHDPQQRFVFLGQAIAQRVKSDTAIVGLNTQP